MVDMPVNYEGNADASEAAARLGRLHRLEVGPFRGFMSQEVFDLTHDITLIYGANGTGKSSFFEALEVAMLGTISEAQLKRVDQKLYCNNARIGRHAAPVLIAGEAETIQPVRPDESEYRFCFIEKNRLDDFARIAARTPSDQRQLIATLFGVDQFSEFVRGFNPSLDQDLMLSGPMAAQLVERKKLVISSEQAIAEYPQKISDIELQENALAERMSPGATYQSCVEWLEGTPLQQGRQPYVQAQLDAVPPPVHGITQSRLKFLFDEEYRLQESWQEACGELAKRATEISFAKLYEAVQAFAIDASTCPACGTSLDAVTEDPYARANAGLEALAQLGELQRREQSLRAELTESVRQLWEEMRCTITASMTACPEALQAASLPILPQTSVGSLYESWVAEDRQAWRALLSIASAIEQVDIQSSAILNQRTALTQERDRLIQFRYEIERLRTQRRAADIELAAAQATIIQFNENNRELLAAIEAEKPIVQLNQRIKLAYDAFLPVLQQYMAALPGILLQGLGEQARNLYNAFNRSDAPGDMLYALHLPVAENGKIEVEFKGQPGSRYDALIIFSEGHIKCLGLAILLAKNIVQGCPVVIFDDVVNAIDDEHRDGIWRTFFEDGLLDNKQIILTSHAEEFLMRIQQELGAARADAIKRYKFLPHTGEHELRIDSHPPTKNYVLLAQQALDGDEKREALRHSRPALESLTDSLWSWMGRRGDGRIEIKLSGPRSPWELNNKCSKLKSAVNRIAAQYPGALDAAAALERLLGVSGASIEWGYLNSGVHDSQRDHEFDRATVRIIVESIVSLDAAISTMRNQ
jgi:energy-coupling factor transporter ATP-binding protein EcfA2